ncbi:MAG TPA: hypothetical protein VFS23_37530 [Vicinamibacterales bacterium]|nr:hypothetical protein [Vicinamibacterales bacterium]
MTTMTRGFVAILGALALVSFMSLQAASAQAPAPSAPAAQAPASPAPAQAGAQKSESARGELKSVDAAKMTLTLANGQTFQYNSSTKVTGAQGGVAGLATMSGREVTIDYETKGADRIAMTITVAADKK